MKKYLLLIENERLWDKFKSVIDRDLNSEIMKLIEEKVIEGTLDKSKVSHKGGKNE